MPDDNKGTPLSEDQNPNPGNQEENIPDWMKEAGWGKDSGAFDESKPVFDNINDEDDIVPADIPAWLEEAAPDGFSADPNAIPAFEGFTEGSYITTGDLVPRTPPEDISTRPAPDPIDKPESEQSEPVQDDTEKSEPELDIPSWLKNLEMDEDSQETAVAWLENMPEDLRATEEEIAASKIPEPETLEPPVDELAWMDDVAKPSEKETDREDLSQAELSEDLVASELIPERGTEEQIFGHEEIQSMENEAPAWLDELGEDDSPTPAKTEADNVEATSPPAPQNDDNDTSLMPDWLSDLGEDEPAPTASEPVPESKEELPSEDSSDIPDWLGEFEPSDEPETEDASGLDWLDSLAGKGTAPSADEQISTDQEEVVEPESTELIPETSSERDDDISPLDETLNTQVPDWLSKIGDVEEADEDTEVPAEAPAEEEASVEFAPEPVKNEFNEKASWLDEIDKPIENELAPETSAADGEVMNWLENMDEKPDEVTAFDDLRDSLTGELEADDPDQKPVELETAKYFSQEEESSESMPDWLSELADDDAVDPNSLEGAIRQSDHSLSPEEKDFLDQAEETNGENADWLAKLDLTDDETISEVEIPAIKVDLPDEDTPLETPQTQASDDRAISGGILDRLDDLEDSAGPKVPQWLENLKKEEDPQETAILWLKQFVERGNEANLQDEIKRYTDELNPGDIVPKWMEDLKHEEDPQTTAMLWLEKLAAEHPAPEKPEPPKEEVEAGWLAELDKEVEEKSQLPTEQTVKDFQDTNNGWLADLEIDEKLKTEETELPDLSSAEPEDSQESDTPLWMKATSPLEGDFHTDELAGSAEKEVEIPAWLAGYGEGEEPAEATTPPVPEPPADTPEPDDYTWVAEAETAAPQKIAKEPIDLNKAAISQLESILGISYRVAQGIVRYREKQGPFREMKDLLNVPEINDEQTIEILKPEVVIQYIEEKPKPKTAPKPVAQDASVEERMQLAKALISESQITEALEHYSFLIKKKKSIPQIIEILIQSSADNPVDISIMKTLGDAYMRIDKLDEALAAYSRAEELLR